MFFSKKLNKYKNISHCFFSKKGGFSKGVYKIAGVDRSMSNSILDPDYSAYGLPWVNQIEIDTLNSHERDINIMISKKPRSSRLLSAEWVSNRWGRLTFDSPINEYKSIIPINIISDSVGCIP